MKRIIVSLLIVAIALFATAGCGQQSEVIDAAKSIKSAYDGDQSLSADKMAQIKELAKHSEPLRKLFVVYRGTLVDSKTPVSPPNVEKQAMDRLYREVVQK